MKFKGKTFAQANRDVVEIVRENHETGEQDVYELVVSPLPCGWYRRMKRLGIVSYPSPPLKTVTVEGRKIKDAAGKLELRQDTDDPLYVEQCARVTDRLQVLKLVTVLRNDPSVSWEAQEPPGDDQEAWAQYADALILEVEDCGLTDDEFRHLIDTADRLANGVKVEESMKDFLDQ